MTTPDLYDPNVPELKSNSLAFSQGQLVNNFSKLYDAFSRNHVQLDNGTTGGNHTIIDLLRQPSSLQTALNQMSLYTKLLSGNTDELYMRFEQNGTEFVYSCYQIYTVDDYNYFTFLPGNLIIYFGTINTVAANTLVNNTLTLKPPIVKFFLGASVCPIGSLPPRNKPVFTIVTPPPNSPYSKVQFFSSSGSFGAAAPASQYIIIASAYQGGT